MKRLTLAAAFLAAMAGATAAQASIASDEARVRADRQHVRALEQQVWRDRVNGNWHAASVDKERLRSAKLRYDSDRSRLRADKRMARA